MIARKPARPFAISALLLVGCWPLAAKELSLSVKYSSDAVSRSVPRPFVWEQRRTAWVPKTTQAPTIDGKANEDCWQRAALLTGYSLLSAGARLPEIVSEAWVLYDDRNLYIVCRYEEPKPDGMRASVKRNDDVNVWQDDAIEIHLDANCDRVSYRHLITNSLGARYDNRILKNRTVKGKKEYADDLAWNADWQVASTVAGTMWTTEMAIGLASIGCEQPREGQAIGFNIGRNRYVAGYEIQSWAQDAYHKPELFGRLILGRERARGYEVRALSVVPALGESIVKLRLVRVGATEGEIGWTLTASPEKGEPRRSEGRFVVAGNREKVIELPAFIPRPGKTNISLTATDLATKDRVLSASTVVEVPELLEQFYLHRAKYFDCDTQLSATLRLSGNSDTLSRLTTRVSLLREKSEEIASCAMPPIEAPRCHLKADIAGLTCGSYSVRVALQNRQQETLCSSTRPFVIEEATPAKRGRIKVHVDEPTGRERRAWPVTVGVPFPRCALRVADHDKCVRVLTSKGVEIPCQTQVTATWTEARHFVKWLLVDCQVDLSTRTGADLFVEYGADVERQAAAPTSLRVTDTEDGVQVSTGPLQFSVARREPKLFDSLTLDGAPVLDQQREDGLYLTTQDPATLGRGYPRQEFYDRPEVGQRYLASLAPDGCQVSIETHGPLRSVVKATGTFATESGDTLFDYIVRYYVYAGKPWVKVFHTFVATKPDEYIRSMGLRLRLPDRFGQVVFGGKDGCHHAPTWSRRKDSMFLLQDRYDHYGVYFLGLKKTWPTLEVEGRRAAGWVDLSNRKVGVTVCMQDFWQEFPKELCAREGKLLEIGLVPQHGIERLDLRTLEGEQCTGKSIGVAKTHRMTFQFHRAGVSQELLAASAAGHLDEPIAAVDPVWMSASNVLLERFAALTTPEYRRYKRAMENLLDMAIRDTNGGPTIWAGLCRYGLLNYGDQFHGMDTRGWFNNEDYFIPFLEWTSFMATGRRDFYEWVSARTRHIIDVDTLHYDPASPEQLGLNFRHRRLHWGGGRITTHTYVDQSLLYYYLTGYERGLDHAIELERGQLLWKHVPDPANGVARDWGVPIRYLMDVYLHTWNPNLLDLARDHLIAFLKTAKPDGAMGKGYFNTSRGTKLYFLHTGDQALLPKVLRAAPSWGRYGAEMPHFFHEMTGDTTYLAEALGALDMFSTCAQEVTPGRPDTWLFTWAEEYRHLPNMFVLPVLEDLKAKGREPQPAYPKLIMWEGKTRDIVLLEENDGPVTVKVDLQRKCFDPTRLTVFGPTREPVLKREIAPGNKGLLGVMTFTAPPDGKTGLYHFRFETKHNVQLLEETVGKHVYPVTRRFTFGNYNGGRVWFHVPEACEKLTLKVSQTNRVTRYGAALKNWRGDVVAEKSWPWEESVRFHDLPAEVPRPGRGKPWSLVYHCRARMPIELDEQVPLFVSDSEESFFWVPELADFVRTEE